MFTLTHGVNTYLNMLKKKKSSNQTKTWSRNEIQAAKIKYIVGGKQLLHRKKQGEISENF